MLVSGFSAVVLHGFEHLFLVVALVLVGVRWRSVVSQLAIFSLACGVMLASFVLSAVSVRFVFPAVSAEGPAFWIVRKAPTSMASFLWSKFWTGLVPVLLMAETLTILSNHYLGVLPELQALDAVAVVFITFALVVVFLQIRPQGLFTVRSRTLA